MSNQQPEMRRDMLLRRALVPKGYRPTKVTDIEKMLNTIDSKPMSEDKKQRMLRKIDGLEPIFPERSVPHLLAAAELSEQEQELVALHRAQNKPLPPDLAARVKEMEERASRNPTPPEESQGG